MGRKRDLRFEEPDDLEEAEGADQLAAKRRKRLAAKAQADLDDDLADASDGVWGLQDACGCLGASGCAESREWTMWNVVVVGRRCESFWEELATEPAQSSIAATGCRLLLASTGQL